MAETSPTRRHPDVVNVDEVVSPTSCLTPESLPPEMFGEHPKAFDFKMRRLAGETSAKQIGFLPNHLLTRTRCSHYEVPPGKTSWPFHSHLATEEGVYILSGEGTLRLRDETVEVRTGDYLCFPVGKDHPHQLINTHPTDKLIYLCISANAAPDICFYPDSNKIGAYDNGQGFRALIHKEDASAKYYSRENGEEVEKIVKRKRENE